MKHQNFVSRLLLISFILISFNFLNAQTIFEDAVALNFKTAGTFNAACFNSAGALIVAKVIKSAGDAYLEIGIFDDNGNYTKKSLVELKSGFNEIKVKFNNNADRVAIYTSGPEDKNFFIADVASGNSIEDIDAEGVVNFAFTSDGNSMCFATNAASFLYDYSEGNLVRTFKDNVMLSMSKDGNNLYCKAKNDVVNIIDLKTTSVVRSFVLKDYKSIEFDPKGELIGCNFPPYLRFFKFSQSGVSEVKDFENVFNPPAFSSSFEYCVTDDYAIGKRSVYSLTENLIYQSKIDPYTSQGTFVFSSDDKRMVLLTDKYLYYYDFEMIKYFSRMSKRFTDLYQVTDQFQTDQDLQNRADRIKSRKKDLLSVFTDELKVSEATVKNKQHYSIGVFETKITGLGIYDPNSEMYEVTISIPVNYTTYKDITAKVKIPKSQGEIFNNYWKNFKVTGLRLLNNNLNGVFAFNIQIINDVNNVVYRCIIHRTLPLSPMSYDEKYNLAQKNYDSRDWFEAVLYLSDFPDDFVKNSVIDMMMQNSLNYYFDEKWQFVSTLGLSNTDPGQYLVYLSDFPKNYKTIDMTDRRKTIVDYVLDGRLQKVKDMIKDKSYTEALEYMDKSIPKIYTDVYSGMETEYGNYNDTKPVRNTLYYEIGKRSIDGGNWQRAVDMLSQITPDFPNYSDAQSLLKQAQSQIK